MALFTIPTDVSQKATLGVLNCYTTQIDLAIVGRERGRGECLCTEDLGTRLWGKLRGLIRGTRPASLGHFMIKMESLVPT